ncbi:MAG: S1 RNA-binding domain-containing protein [Treponema sp.]|nr:S1 RNA-binding domain-containing protein [Treponema sp.]
MQGRLEIGQQIETEIVAVTDTTIFLDLNAKSEGVLDRAELADEEGNVSVKEGDKIKVYFTGEVHGEMRFTTKISGGKADLSMLENAWKNHIPVEGHVASEIKGGFEVKLGSSRAFCPYSQMGFKKKEEPAFYVGKHLNFIITEFKNDGKDILVSNRLIGEREYEQGLAKLSMEIKEGAVVQAVVESIEKFGAFVNIQGFRALLPISEMSLDRVQDAGQIVKAGEEITVKVIRTDWEHEKVSVSLKALMADPWENVSKKFTPGTKVDGEISRIADFGLFVNLDKGIDGLVHISELEDVSANTNLRKVYKIGQKMSVVVEKVDAAQKRISLVPATSKEQDETAQKYLSSQDDDGETYNPFAALLKK